MSGLAPKPNDILAAESKPRARNVEAFALAIAAGGAIAFGPAAHAAQSAPAADQGQPAGQLQQDHAVAVPSVTVVGQTATDDPFQKVNRATFDLNMGMDRYVLAPVAHGYMRVTPSPVRSHISSAVDNLGEPSTAINDVAQGHFKLAAKTTSRFVINSTVGVLGFFDVASKMDMPRHDGDFGQTLGRYGVKPGPYLMVPLLGPTNVRDGFGRVVDVATDPIGWVTGGVVFRAARGAATALDTRVAADPALRALDDVTDPYVTVRSAYGQQRAAAVRAASGQTDAEALPDFDEPPPGI